MSSLAERLVESWLDSQTERRYQNAFVQMLVSTGWQVLHNTRHSPLEFGKDVVARSPEGELFAFQLKGNPGSRLTKSEAQGLLAQIIELIDVPIPRHLMKSGSEKHIAVLVTNGEIDEEAQTEFTRVAERINRQSPSKSFEMWSRGRLLGEFLKTAKDVWPTSIEGNRSILNLMREDGRAQPNLLQVSELMRATAPRPSRKASARARMASLTALLLVVEIAKSAWYEAENHYALYVFTVVAALYALQFGDSRQRANVVRQYANVALSHAADLVNEAESKDFDPDRIWTESNPLSDFDFMWERRNLVAECAAALLLQNPVRTDINLDYARSLIEASIRSPMIWGEGAIPSFIVRYWSIYAWGGIALEFQLARVLKTLVEANRGRIKGVQAFAAPYYSFTSCWARTSGAYWLADRNILEETFEGRLTFGRSLMMMLAKRNMKQTCKALWPGFSQILHECYILPEEVFPTVDLAVDGEHQSQTYYSATWDELLEDIARKEAAGAFLDGYHDMPWLIASYVAIVPYRAWEGVLLWLDRQLCRTWY